MSRYIGGEPWCVLSVRMHASRMSGTISVNSSSRSRRTTQMVPDIREACILTLSTHQGSPPIYRDMSLGQLGYPVPRQPGASPDDLRDLIFAHLLLTSWILVDARNQLQYNMAEMAYVFLCEVVSKGLVEVTRRWFDRRP